MRRSIHDTGIHIALFTVIGISVGAAGALAISQSGGSFAAAFLFVAFLPAVYVAGPILGGVIGLATGIARGDRTAIYSSTIGSFIGFYLFVGISLLLLVAGMMTVSGGGNGGGGGGGGDIPWLVVAAMGVPTGGVGGVASYLGSRFR